MSEAFCYVCIKPDRPGAYAAAVDLPDSPEAAKDTAKMIAKAVRQGHRVERVTVVRAREMLGEYMSAEQTK